MRFGFVVVGGLFLDLGIAWSLANLAGVPLEVAAVAGFFSGALFNYVLHEFWTFRSPNSRVSGRRVTLYFVMMVAVLGIRVGVVALLSHPLHGPLGSLLALVCASGVSFVANYLLSRFVVYRRGHQGELNGIGR
ncbi:GtrA family protein [Aquabacter sp. L1I39]|uniref:GtrA family protein n=1 Tax=Aquabacter sp. L1I39 TaxID=2820278 RepID=UPI001ADCE222|nr:GtrA family protein [Aquabacter sp. L1I39]QTL03815.1 GtrA family protein [Aquabacter sp. L1I39]